VRILSAFGVVGCGSQPTSPTTDAGAGDAATDAAAVGDAIQEEHESCVDAGPCTIDGWCPLDVGPGRLRGIWGSDTNDVWVVGDYLDNSLLLHWDGCAWSSQWSAQNPLRWYPLLAISGSAANDVWALSVSCNVMHWNGITWTELASSPPDCSSLSASVWNSGSSDVWFLFGGIDGAAVDRWNGNSWSTAYRVGPMASLRALAGTSSTDVWAVGGKYWKPWPLLAFWDGVKWTDTAWGAISAVGHGAIGVSARSQVDVTILLYGNQPVWQWDGMNWSELIGAPQGGLIWEGAANDVWVAANNGFMSHWDGTKWSASITANTNNLASFWGNARELWVVGDNGTVLRRKR